MPTAGKVYYDYVHRPCRFVRRFFAYDGFVQKHVNQREAGKMRAAALQLHFPPPEGGGKHFAHYLTGQSHWHMSVYAAASLVMQTRGVVQPVFHNDGTLDRALAARLQGIFPAAQFVLQEEQQKLMVEHVPADRFPVLNKLWREFVLFRKLFCIHLWRNGWKLCLDSDMLFWRSPEFLLDWLESPDEAVCMRDIDYAYSVSPEVVDAIAGKAVPTLINTGVIGLHSGMVDPNELEGRARKLLESRGYRVHFLEQTMTAMMLASRPFKFAPPGDYCIPQAVADCSPVSAVCQHYIPVTRGWMYRKGWRYVHVLATGGGLPR
jgi:hypothetical protein